LLMLSEGNELRGMLFWLMGDLSTPQFLPVLLVCLIGVLTVGFWLAPRLNVLRLGEASAISLGVSMRKIHYCALCCVAVSSAAVVICAGSIAWVGFLVPHVVRRIVGNDLRCVMPLSVLFGANLLLLSDLVARLCLYPTQLPVGVVTALLGAPVKGI
jgi:iron complex transport system permease protein